MAEVSADILRQIWNNNPDLKAEFPTFGGKGVSGEWNIYDWAQRYSQDYQTRAQRILQPSQQQTTQIPQQIQTPPQQQTSQQSQITQQQPQTTTTTQTSTTPTQTGYASGTLLREKGDNKVYLITDNGFKFHIPDEETFNSLGFKWTDVQEVPQGSLSTVKESTGDASLDTILSTLQTYLTKLTKSGQTINPYVEITPEKVSEFMSQAATEIDPYYVNQLKAAKEGFLRSIGYSTDEIVAQEKQLEKKYGQSLQTLGEAAAEQGFAQSGIRQKQEQQLAEETQQTIDTARRKLAFDTGTTARTLAQTWGGDAVSIPQIQNAPRAIAGEMKFQTPSTNSALYELSPEVYQGLIGSQQWEQQAAKKTRTSELESAWKQNELANRYRQLNLA